MVSAPRSAAGRFPFPGVASVCSWGRLGSFCPRSCARALSVFYGVWLPASVGVRSMAVGGQRRVPSAISIASVRRARCDRRYGRPVSGSRSCCRATTLRIRTRLSSYRTARCCCLSGSTCRGFIISLRLGLDGCARLGFCAVEGLAEVGVDVIPSLGRRLLRLVSRRRSAAVHGGHRPPSVHGLQIDLRGGCSASVASTRLRRRRYVAVLSGEAGRTFR